MRRLITTSRFRKDVRRLEKRGPVAGKLLAIVRDIRLNGTPPESTRPHRLVGSWTGYLEYHIGFDWLLIYQVDRKEVRLYRIGTHSDLFG